MDRKQFIRMMGGATGILGLSSFQDLTNTFKEEDETMPTLFVGHGSPMNAIEDNEFSARWRQMGKEITKPKAVVCVSAHWLTRGSHVTAMNNPKTFTILVVSQKLCLMPNILRPEVPN
jgi:4,5-DOPA dioxygenase extradiol